jgi:hypothetical protein
MTTAVRFGFVVVVVLVLSASCERRPAAPHRAATSPPAKPLGAGTADAATLPPAAPVLPPAPTTRRRPSAQEVQAAIATIEVDGVYEVLIEDGFTQSLTHHFVVDRCGKRTRLKFHGAPPPWQSGVRIHVRGVKDHDGALTQTTMHDLGPDPVSGDAAAVARARCP